MVDYDNLVLKTAHNNPWFYDQYYADGKNDRFLSFQLTLNLLNLVEDKGRPVIVETGCQREENDLGAGMSTSIFAEFINRYGGHLVVVDNSEQHLNRAYSFILKKWKNLIDCGAVQFVLSDSVEFLQKDEKHIWDLVYLDSYDYPYVAMLDRLGREPDGNNQPEIEQLLWRMDEEEIKEKFSDLIDPCQQHCLNEFKAIESKIRPGGLLLVDDNHFPGGGKPGKLLNTLAAHPCYDHIYTYQQTLWIRGK